MEGGSDLPGTQEIYISSHLIRLDSEKTLIFIVSVHSCRFGQPPFATPMAMAGETSLESHPSSTTSRTSVLTPFGSHQVSQWERLPLIS